MDNDPKHPALLWEPTGDKEVSCGLCNFRCRIKPGKRGHCQVRENYDGKLYSLNYSAVCSVSVDPIEKKPLFHFYPGSRSLSYAAPGCNFRCEFCQNWQISQQVRLWKKIDGQAYSSQQLVQAGLDGGCASVAHTYTEPTIYFELAYETAKLAHKKGLTNVFVSNGYMTIEAIEMIKPYLDGINVDLKSFRDEFYRQRTGARLEPVLETLRHIAKQPDIWLEITTLIIPQANDSDEELGELAKFINDELGPQVPWHVSRFHPQYKFSDTEPTPSSTLQRAFDIAKAAGLKYVYIGNLRMQNAENTCCPKCKELLIEREEFCVTRNKIINSQCPDCGEKIAGFNISSR